MNPIQQAWLKVLQPVSIFINEKLAKRSGMLGRIGRFFIIGPREYGFHPINQAFVYMNRRYMTTSAFMLHKYSVMKGMTHQGYHMMRPMRSAAFIAPIFVLAGCFRMVFFSEENKSYQPDNLDYLMKRSSNAMQFPLNSLNQRTSAHYTEISTIYAAEMMKRYHKVHSKIIRERSQATDKERKTRFADPSYVYEAMPQVHIDELKPV